MKLFNIEPTKKVLVHVMSAFYHSDLFFPRNGCTANDIMAQGLWGNVGLCVFGVCVCFDGSIWRLCGYWEYNFMTRSGLSDCFGFDDAHSLVQI